MQDHKPAIILISPQLGENIGAAARAMHNFGLNDLRLVSPRDGWPNREAVEVARNAASIIDKAKIYPNLLDATADIKILYATTARPRGMVKHVITPRKFAEEVSSIAAGKKSALMFGPERTGMSNDDIVLADKIITIPVSKENTSLNLAQAVAVVCYEWFANHNEQPDEIFRMGESLPATKAEISMLLINLEAELEKRGFFNNTKMRPRMIRNLDNIFTRNNLTSQEVKTLRGVIKNLISR